MGVSCCAAAVASSSAGTLDLVEAPVHPALTAAGMAATMVLSPMCVDETFVVQIVAHTGDSALAAWQLTFLYDESVLELQSTVMMTHAATAMRSSVSVALFVKALRLSPSARAVSH